MKLLSKLAGWFGFKPLPRHLQRGLLGERAAKKHLKKSGLKFLMANFKCSHGEIDLVFREGDALIFVEVKTRSSEEWVRPAAAVDKDKKERLSLSAIEYLRQLRRPRVKFRFDIVEVLLENETVKEIRHLPDAFTSTKTYRYR